jgi:hypothetical protein
MSSDVKPEPVPPPNEWNTRKPCTQYSVIKILNNFLSLTAYYEIKLSKILVSLVFIWAKVNKCHVEFSDEMMISIQD